MDASLATSYAVKPASFVTSSASYATSSTTPDCRLYENAQRLIAVQERTNEVYIQLQALADEKKELKQERKDIVAQLQIKYTPLPPPLSGSIFKATSNSLMCILEKSIEIKVLPSAKKEIPAELTHQTLMTAIKNLRLIQVEMTDEERQAKDEDLSCNLRLNHWKNKIDTMSGSKVDFKRWAKKLKTITDELLSACNDEIPLEQFGKGLDDSAVDLVASRIIQAKERPEILHKELRMFQQILEFMEPHLKRLVEEERQAGAMNAERAIEKSKRATISAQEEKAKQLNALLDPIRFKTLPRYPNDPKIDIRSDILKSNICRTNANVIILRESGLSNLAAYNLRIKTVRAAIKAAATKGHKYVPNEEYHQLAAVMAEFEDFKHRPTLSFSTNFRQALQSPQS